MESPQQLVVDAHTQSQTPEHSRSLHGRRGGAAAGGSTSAQKGTCRGVLASWAGPALAWRGAVAVSWRAFWAAARTTVVTGSGRAGPFGERLVDMDPKRSDEIRRDGNRIALLSVVGL